MERRISPTVINTVDPTVTNDKNSGYTVPFFWFNTSSGALFCLKDASVGAAVWTAISSGGGGGTVTSVSGESGVVSVATGTTTPVISLTASGVTNAKLATMATLTLKGNSTGGTTNPSDLSVATVQGMLHPAPGPIGGTTPNTIAATTISATGQITSTLTTGTAPLVVASTTVVTNLNSSLLNGATFPAPGAIGGTTPGSVAATAITATTTIAATGVVTGANLLRGTGSPEGVVTAVIGSIFQRTDGTTDTAVYKKETGAGNTGWIAIAAGGSGGNPFSDVSDLVKNSSDATKTFKVLCTSQTTATLLTLSTGAQTTSRTLSVPVLAANDTLAVAGLNNSFTESQTFTKTSLVLQATSAGNGRATFNLEQSFNTTQPVALRLLGGSATPALFGFRGTELTIGPAATNATDPSGVLRVASGSVTINPLADTDATSIITGVLIVGSSNGGIGVAGQIWVGKHILTDRGIGLSKTETASSGSTITLSATSKTYQKITGTTAQTITVPSVVFQGAGTQMCQMFIIDNATNQTATINPTGSGTIQGAGTYSLPAQTCVRLLGPSIANGDWRVI